MKKFEKIDDVSHLGIHWIFTEILDTDMHYHNEIELIFVYSGELEIHTEQEEIQLKENEFAAIDGKVLHELKGTNNKVLVIHIFNRMFSQLGFLKLAASVVKSGRKDEKLIKKEIDILSDVRYENQTKLIGCKIINFLLYMYQNKMIIHQTNNINCDPLDREAMERLVYTLDYIEEHHAERINIDHAAKEIYVSSSYLSFLLKTYIGYTFWQYLNLYRVECTKNDLITTNDTITDICMNHGFFNVKTFNRVFKNIAGCTPSQFRKKKGRIQTSVVTDTGIDYSYRAISFEDLESRTEVPALEKTRKDIKLVKIQDEISLKAPTQKINLYWNKMLCIGRAHEILRASVQKQIRMACRDIGYQYVRFHGIFHDDMGVICRINNKIYYNFTYVDEIFDFLLENGLKPFLEISFMPSILSLGEETIFWYKANVCPPADMSEWCNLVRHFIKHLIERYSTEELETWYFEIWNEPDISEFFHGTFDDYMELYSATVTIIKSLLPKAKVGGPACSGQYRKQAWVERFLYTCEKEKYPLDFISCHFYEADYNYCLDDGRIVEIYDDKYEIYQNLLELKSDVDSVSENKLEIHITEWNSSAKKNDLIHDTAFKGSFVIKTLVKCLGTVDSLGYWILSDIFEEDGIMPKPFYGGLGLVNKWGLKKPPYFAYMCLAMLKDEMLKKTDYFIVTRDEHEIQVLVWNYVHYGQKYSFLDDKNVDYYNRYALLAEDKILKFEMKFPELKNSKCKVSRYSFEKKEDCIFDIWLEEGGLEYADSETLQMLKDKNHMNTEINIKQPGKPMTLKKEIMPYGFTLWKIRILS